MNNLKHFVIWWLTKIYRKMRALLPALVTIAIIGSVASLALITFGFLIVFSADAKGTYVEGDYLFLAKLAVVPTIILLCAYIRLQWEQWQAEQEQTIYDLRQQYGNQK